MKTSLSLSLLIPLLFVGCEDNTVFGGGESYTWESTVTGRLETVFVYYPDEYEAETPVIYLLNGFGADAAAWGSGINLAKEAEDRDLFFVSLTAGANLYMNHPSDSSKQYADFVLEVLSEIENLYGITITWRERALCGISNGGGGAVYLLSQYPNRFHAAGCLSGSVYSGIDYEGLKGRRIRIDVGTEDFNALGRLRYLDTRLREELITHEYQEHSGGHNWDFWKKWAPEQFDYLQDRISD